MDTPPLYDISYGEVSGSTSVTVDGPAANGATSHEAFACVFDMPFGLFGENGKRTIWLPRRPSAPNGECSTSTPAFLTYLPTVFSWSRSSSWRHILLRKIPLDELAARIAFFTLG